VMIVAYVRPARRAAVASALRLEGILAWSESRVDGHGRAAGGHGVPHTRFEIVLETEYTDACLDAIGRAAQTGEVGDGFVVTLPVVGARRLSDHASLV